MILLEKRQLLFCANLRRNTVKIKAKKKTQKRWCISDLRQLKVTLILNTSPNMTKMDKHGSSLFQKQKWRSDIFYLFIQIDKIFAFSFSWFDSQWAFLSSFISWEKWLIMSRYWLKHKTKQEIWCLPEIWCFKTHVQSRIDAINFWMSKSIKHLLWPFWWISDQWKQMFPWVGRYNKSDQLCRFFQWLELVYHFSPAGGRRTTANLSHSLIKSSWDKPAGLEKQCNRKKTRLLVNNGEKEEELEGVSILS